MIEGEEEGRRNNTSLTLVIFVPSQWGAPASMISIRQLRMSIWADMCGCEVLVTKPIVSLGCRPL